MKILEYIKNDTLLIIPNNIKTKILEMLDNEPVLYNIKIMNLEELRKHYYFDYELESILFIMDKYNLKHDTASDILKSLYIIDDTKYKNNQLTFLQTIKKDLEKNNLIIYDNYFKDYLKNRKILVYGYSKINKFYLNLINEIDAEIIVDDEKKIKSNVYLLNTLEEEVEYVFNRVSELITNGIPINKIKFTNLTNKYIYTIKRFSNIYNIPVFIDDNNIYSSQIVKLFLKKLHESKSFHKALDYLSSNFNLDNESNKEIYKLLLNISSKYNDLKYSFEKIYEVVLNDIKSLINPSNKYKNQIEIINLDDNIFDDDYIFVFNFNQGEIPKFYKDEDYILDSVKIENNLLVETTTEKNILSKKSTITSLNRISNHFITCKEKSIDGDYLISNLCNELEFNIIRPEFNYNISYSSMNSKIKLTKYLDQFIKYGVKDKKLDILYNNFNTSYLKYNNKFTGIENSKLLEKIKPKLVLSYTNIDTYYHCAFRYYISNILKLDAFSESFNTIIGNLFHYVLSICFNADFNFDKEYYNYIDKIDLNSRELFFLNKLKKELELVIGQVKRFHNETGLTKLLLEHRINIDKSSIIPVVLTGIVDKIMYRESENTLVSIVDYKTGSNDIDLYNIIYGIGMQLPIYLYLVNKSELFSNVRFTGFYLQKILSKEVNFTLGRTYIEQKESNLKLEGYSNNDYRILEVFLPDYENSKYVKSMKITSNGFSTYSKILSDKEIKNLSDFVDKKIDEARDNILLGKFDINPKIIDGENVGCKFCKYKDLCFRTTNDFKRLPVNKSLDFLGGDNNA